MKYSKYIVEFLGAALLTAVVILVSAYGAVISQGGAVLGTMVIALVLGFIVYTVGHVSGAHVNPAITIAALTLKKISAKDAGFYIIAQVLGGIVAFIAVKVIASYHPLFDVPQARQITEAIGGLGLFKGAVFVGSREFIKLLAETAGTAVFAFGVSAVMFGKVSEQVKGALISASLFLGSLIAVLLGSFDAATLATRGLLNPAVALGFGFPGSLSLAYIVGPIIGAVIGANLYRLLAVEESGQEKISL